MDILAPAIFIIGLIASIVLAAHTEKTFSKVILVIQWLSILCVLLDSGLLRMVGWMVFALSLVLILVYSFFEKNLTGMQRAVLYGITLPIGVLLLIIMESWPFEDNVSLLMVIPMVTLGVALINRSRLKNEIGFLFLPGALASLEFVDYLRDFF